MVLLLIVNLLSCLVLLINLAVVLRNRELVAAFKRAAPRSGGELARLIHLIGPRQQSRWLPIWNTSYASWSTCYPEHELRLWDDSDIDELLQSRLGTFHNFVKAYPLPIHRYDVARYCILYLQGGIYADMDFECLKPFDHVLEAGKVAVAESPYDHERAQNALLASPPGHPFWVDVTRELLRKRFNPLVVKATGPHVIESVASRHPGMVQFLPRRQFTLGGEFALHHNSHSWTDQEKAMKKGNSLWTAALLRLQKHFSAIYARLCEGS